MSVILSLETTTNICSVALHQDGNLMACKESHTSQSHSKLLALYIRDIMQESNIKVEELDAVAVSEGPGSYTGVRIGVSTAKGLCYGLSIPLIAVNTLQAMAHGIQKFLIDNPILCPMIDARRMEVYTLLMDTQSRIIMKSCPLIVDENSFSDYLSSARVVFFGNGADKCKTIISHPNAVFIDAVNTSAVPVGEIAEERYRQKQFEDLAYFEPNYLKEFRVGKPKL